MGREIPVAGHLVRFDTHPEPIAVPAGTLIGDAARLAGIEIRQPCGGQGRCGRCAVQVESGSVRRRSVLRLSKADLDAGFALACQTLIEGDVSVLQVNKFNDLRVALEAARTIEERLSLAFLLHSAVQRNAERVTAEEIRFMAAELEDALGGLYTVLSQELQLPLVKSRITRLTKSKKLPK